MRTTSLFLHTAMLGALLVLLLSPYAVPSANAGFVGSSAITGAAPGQAADFTWFPSKNDDPPPHGRADGVPIGKGDDPPPYG
jgi:hypothetical protein